MIDQQTVWSRRRKIRGGLVLSVSLQPADRIALDRLVRNFGLDRRQDAIRALIRAAGDELAAHAEAGDAKR